MKKFLLACSGAFLLAAACGQSGPGGSSPGSGGSSGGTSSGAAGADSPGTGGSNTGVAGTVGSGGNSNPGTAGSSNPGTAGSSNPGTAGNNNPGSAGNNNPGSAGNGSAGNGSAGNGSAGTVGSGGVTGSGGRGGTTGAGGTAGTGTGTGGRGGTTGAGGTAGTGTGTGGRGGTTGTGGSGTGGTDLMSVAAPLDGYYWEGTCSGNVTASGRNCPFYASGVTTCAAGTSWDNRGTITSKTLKMNGTPGVAYTVSLTIRGVVGTRCYTGGTAPTGSLAAGGTPSASAANSTWYVGGKQYNDSIWNTYEIHVSPSVAGQANVFYANAFGTDAVNSSWCQKEATYQVGYTTKLPVMGDSTLTFTIHDTNCQAQQNCGGNDTSTVCDMMRTVSLSDLTPPGTFAQPPTNSVAGKTYYPQWLYFDVTSVSSP